MVYRYALYLLIAYALLCLVVFVFQRRLLYLPTTYDKHRLEPPSAMAYWPEDGADYLGLIGGPTASKGTILVFHGNAGSARDRNYYLQALAPRGYRVILAEYPGYGGRDGRPSEKACVAQAREMIATIRQTSAEPLYLWGESLGAGVVSAVAKQAGADIDGLVLITPWHALADLAQSVYWFLPVRLLLLDRFHSGKNLASFDGPVAVLIADGDTIIPRHHGDKLFDRLQDPKKRWVFEGAGHNSWPVDSGAAWWDEVITFLETNRVDD